MDKEDKPKPSLNIIFINFNDDYLNSCLEWQGTEEIKNQWSEKKFIQNNIYEREIQFEQKDDKIDYYFYWKSIIYPKITKENKESIFDSLNEDQILEEKKLIIIIFGEEYLSELFEFHKVLKDYGIEIQIGIVTDKKYISSENNSINMYLTNIKYDKENIKETSNNLFKYIFERDCYFNERENILENNISLDISLNILLMGISRRGKSAFVNLLSRKFVACSLSSHEGITKGIKPYLIDQNVNNKNIGIKLYDTPGFTDENGEEVKKVVESIKNFLSPKNDSVEEYHIFYYFLGNDCLEKQKEAFKFIKEKNEERTKEGLKEIPVIFIYNTYPGVNKNDLRTFLKNNGFYSLYKDNIFENQDQNKKGFRKKIKDNIIKANLKSLNDSKIEGVKEILETSLQLLKNNNKFEEKDFEELKTINENIEKSKEDNDNNKLNEYQNKFIQKRDEISKKYSFFTKCNNINELIKQARENSEKDLKYYVYGGILSGLAGYIPLLDYPVLYFVYYRMVLNISKHFKMENKITYSDIFKLIFGIKDLKFALPGGGKIKENQIKSSIEIFKKKVWNAHGGYKPLKVGDSFEKWIFDSKLYEQKVIDKTYLNQLFTQKKFLGYIPILSSIISGVSNYYHTKKTWENVIKYFEEETRKENGYNYIKEIKENISLLFNFIEKKSNENWNEYQMNEIGF